MWNKVIQLFLVLVSVHQNVGQLGVADYSRYSYDVPTHDEIYSYYTKLMVERTDGSTKSCAGALLTNQWVITSCKWLLSATTVTVHLGNPSIDGYIFDINERNIVHAKRGMSKARSSIQLIKLPEQIKYTETVQRIYLPSMCELASDKEIFIVDFESSQNGDNLQSIASHIVPMSECSKTSLDFNEFTYCIRGQIHQSKQHGHILIKPQGKELIGILNDHRQCYESSFTFHHILEYSRFISDVTGLSLPNCENLIDTNKY